MFLKTCAIAESDGLSGEAERLRWLGGRLYVPEVLSFVKADGREYLLTTGLAGVNGVDAGHDRPEDVTIGLAQALKMLHAQPVEGCPFDQSVAAQISRAQQRVPAGMIDEADFDEERLGRTARELLAELDVWRPLDESRALTHGDPCLPNVMFDKGQFVGFIDCDRAGVADPYQDLTLAARSIGSNLGRNWVPVFFRQYGIQNPDERKLAFYRLLDEFF
jgi:aminoglycoside 3'-phosphotransferase-2